ncbi:hypothetical protein FOTG_17794 [Fusarium oxysporum f. sp. vasinfectum 25433]|uniref:Uncharacterized protein n=1 Tax=Fusarium oxysporum f. sp. vasinfectum 25433 TaxID=1089449 RepID=X0KJE7_FUSOX|nr:hypothetical protein FOTG_17794 [Fusarium oxysporum f. sp. vasinfectum 25433]
MRKGHMTLALNGIAAPQEMHRLKEKALRRAKLEEGAQRYALHRELQEQNKLLAEWQLAVKMPSFYDTTVIAEALRFIVLDEQERRANKALMLGYEADGLEIIEEIEGENGVEEFIIVKGEDSERDLKLSSISIYQLKSYVIP